MNFINKKMSPELQTIATASPIKHHAPSSGKEQPSRNTETITACGTVSSNNNNNGQSGSSPVPTADRDSREQEARDKLIGGNSSGTTQSQWGSYRLRLKRVSHQFVLSSSSNDTFHIVFEV